MVIMLIFRIWQIKRRVPLDYRQVNLTIFIARVGDQQGFRYKECGVSLKLACILLNPYYKFVIKITCLNFVVSNLR